MAPLGLKATGIIRGREIIAGLPEDYDLDAGSARAATHFELANFGGAGGAYSSLRDLWAFDRALIGNALLKAETTAVMLESSPQTGYAALGCWTYPLTLRDGRKLRIVERHGSIGGYNVVNLYCPEADTCVILACNISSFAEPETWRKQGLAYRLLTLVVDPSDR